MAEKHYTFVVKADVEDIDDDPWVAEFEDGLMNVLETTDCIETPVPPNLTIDLIERII
jgi:hypothetical protein